MKRHLAALALFVCLVVWGGPAATYAEEAKVLVSPLDGVVGTVLEVYLAELIERARSEEFDLLVLAIDTPGGLVSSMTAMVNQILTSPVPIVVWVYPYGARAASAGAFIVQAAHVAAMAPGTRIGAAHPVTAGGGDVPSDEMNRKITNDLAAQMRSLAEERGRSAEVAARMVTESLSLTAQEAMSRGVVDVMATELEELLVAINGRKVVVGGRKIVLDLSDYEVEHTEMPMRLKVLHFISRPDIAYLLLMLGIYAIIFEILSPGGFVLGTSGAIMILLGAYGLRMLPLNWAGIILLIAGITVMVIDLLIGGMGVLSAFGGVAIIVGGLIIYRAPGGELLRYSMTFVTGAVVAATGFFLLALWAFLRSLKTRKASGQEGLVGEPATVVQACNPDGMVLCHGEYWKARSADGEPLGVGERVKVVSLSGLVLLVSRDKEEDVKSGY
ncbi:MAG TPA: nodulation protein NfeD [Thermosynergistes sp.]|nr:nodulation protein NfeD [Thermosynergistes sp.]